MASEVKPKMARVRNTSGQFAKGGKDAEPTGEPGETVAEAVVPVETDEEIARLDAENARLKAELAEAKADAEQWKPTVDIEDWLFDTPDDVNARFDSAALKDIAGAELAQINKERLKRGFLPVDYDEDEWDAEIERAKIDLVADRTRWVPDKGPLQRVLKMVFPTKDTCVKQPCYKHGSLRQIPVEDQINNQAGSLSDGTQRYKDKGGKLCKPFPCSAKECWALAAVSGGKFVHAGYCSEDHRARTEGNQGSAIVTNAITRANVI